jgi:E-phenylitaconyl-CoA hydratase
MTGDQVDAETARKIGLVWRVVAHDDLMDAARELADRLTAAAPLAQRSMKEMAIRARYLSSPDAIRLGEAMRLVASSTEDAREGLLAAAERRAPNWQAR